MTRAIADMASIFRLHIVGIAMAANLVFGWLFSERYLVPVALLGGLDWLLINLLNRISDIQEDTANAIRGTDQVARRRRVFTVAWLVGQAGSLLTGHLLFPQLTVYRVAVQAIGLGYSFRLVPTPWGWRRLKEIYFLKNAMSAVGFVITVFLYPLAVIDFVVLLRGGLVAVGFLVVFFVAFEVTYEILYDMRDLDGDRSAGVPTYPVAHGLERARQLIDGLLVSSGLCLLVGLGAGALGLREALFVGAPVVQFFFYRPRFARGVTSRDCIVLTHLGTVLLLTFLAGTLLWQQAGLPPNIYLHTYLVSA